MPSYDLQFFESMKESTHGMMSASVYFELYKLSRDQSRFDIIDIGVGRGATSVSFALGMRDAGRSAKVHAIDQFFQNRRGPHPYSMETNPQDCVELNVREFQRNLESYNVTDLVETWVGDVADVAKQFPQDVRADLLAIDAAGHIDEFFSYFFDLVEPNGLIVLDDCLDLVDRNAREAIKRMQAKPVKKVLERIDRLAPRRVRLLMGKHKLTFYLASFFEEIGAIRTERLLGKQTKIFRKCYAGRFADLDLSKVKDIETKIVEEYIAACIQ